MDRRQRKTREAIFSAFIELLSKKNVSQITVGEIIDRADVGRATFYSHFETKDFLLRELCSELFCHIFDRSENGCRDHKHIFDCDSSESTFLHLFRHLQKNDNNILELLSCENNEVFLRYFKKGLREMVSARLTDFDARKNEKLPREFWIDHICSVFTETLRWWIDNGMNESPETINEYFHLAV